MKSFSQCQTLPADRSLVNLVWPCNQTAVQSTIVLALPISLAVEFPPYIVPLDSQCRFQLN